MGVEKSNKIEEYIKEVCSLVKNKDVHQDIKLELEDHLETLKEEFISSGMSEEEAAIKAISHMGEASVVGRQLNAAHKARLDLKILLPVIVFSVLGLVSMYIIQASMLVSRGRDMQIFQKSLVFYVIGTLLMLGLYFFDYRRILPLSKYIYIGTLLLLVASIIFGTHVNGRPVLTFGPISIDFIDVSPFFWVIALAGIFQDWNWNSIGKFLIGMLLMAIPVFFLMINGVSIVIVYFVACITLMIVSRAKLYLALLPVAVTLIASWLFTLMEPYRVARLLSFLNPEKDPQGSGWIYIQLHNAIKSAGFLGNKTGNIQSKIPELHTDFIFAYIVSNFGWVAALLIIILIISFMLRMVHVASTAKHAYGKLLSAGIVAVLSTQFLLSITTSLGISPLFGVSMPFMSFGGSHLIMNMVSVGLILSIYRRKNLSNVSLNTKTLQ